MAKETKDWCDQKQGTNEDESKVWGETEKIKVTLGRSKAKGTEREKASDQTKGANQTTARYQTKKTRTKREETSYQTEGENQTTTLNKREKTKTKNTKEEVYKKVKSKARESRVRHYQKGVKTSDTVASCEADQTKNKERTVKSETAEAFTEETITSHESVSGGTRVRRETRETKLETAVERSGIQSTVEMDTTSAEILEFGHLDISEDVECFIDSHCDSPDGGLITDDEKKVNSAKSRQRKQKDTKQKANSTLGDSVFNIAPFFDGNLLILSFKHVHVIL